MDTLEVSLNPTMETDVAKDLELWMTNLPQKLRTTPIIHLAIPGSHDSTTYGITSKSKIAPDAEPIYKWLRFLGPIFKKVMVNWSKTQTVTVTLQLQSGIRYFDLRISTKEKDDHFYFVHGLYGDEVAKILDEIKEFLETHPKEVVILDCQHFYAFQQSDHERLMYLLTSTFGHKLLPYMSHMEHISLQYMTECRYQVIVVYRSDAARFGQPLLWPAVCFRNPWAETVSIPKLITFLTDTLKSRNPSMGFVSQCVLTPTTWFVVKHLFSCLKKQCLLPLQRDKYKWLRMQRPGRGGLNIVISDFAEFEDGRFARAVVGLNRKLLREGERDELTPIDGGR
ncbi:hypothetical protein Zmor_008627 [Zophobas morio]|uniref:Phosphatidylinositol-specific phospholipase C X domain-containing protein n=2 Tax=Zophobas morio TaxID=2755281 RepID=A0AA38LYD1_9CUCU|nr:hypothetical protein Zmor_012290 [Zophobas morio]KAJ3621761.1 hypothetical protein Zmor_008627 [Zophobas morio]